MLPERDTESDRVKPSADFGLMALLAGNRRRHEIDDEVGLHV